MPRIGRHTKEAGLYLQDAYHYFDSILGSGAFVEGETLAGRLVLYAQGTDNLEKALDESLHEHEIPDKLEQDIEGPFELPDADKIKDEEELKDRARFGRDLAEELGEVIGIDAVTGEPPNGR